MAPLLALAAMETGRPTRLGRSPMHKNRSTSAQYQSTVSRSVWHCDLYLTCTGSPVNISFEQLSLLLSHTTSVMWKAVREHLNDCFSNHCSSCPSNGNCPLPSRVIDVEAKDNSEGLSLHTTNPNERGKYVALSYCCKFANERFVSALFPL